MLTNIIDQSLCEQLINPEEILDEELEPRIIFLSGNIDCGGASQPEQNNP